MAASSEIAEQRDDERGRAWPLFVLLLVAGVVLVAIQWRRPKADNPFVGLMLPPIEAGGWLNTPGPLTAGDLRGKIVLVDFWSTTCPTCVRATPELAALHERFSDDGLVIVGFTPEGEAELAAVKYHVQTANVRWPIGYGAGFAFQMMGIEGTPTYLLYDRSGRSVWGGHSLDGADEAVMAAIAREATTANGDVGQAAGPPRSD